MWKQCIPSSWLIKCVFGSVFCQSPVVIPLPGGVARYSPCGVCQEISLWNISLISFGSRISLICIHCSWLDSWLHSDYLLVWHDGVEFFGWNRALTPVYESLDAGVSVFWKSDTGVSLLKIWYMSIFWDWWYMSIFWDCMLIHNFTWNFSIFIFQISRNCCT